MTVARSLVLASLAALAACHDAEAGRQADERLRKAIVSAMCADTKEDRVLGLAAVAEEAAGVADDYREDTVQTMAEEVTAADCTP